MKTKVLSFAALICLASYVRGQCPPNAAMGICHPVAKPCYGDNECYNGEICCPDSCSRSCKPRRGRGSPESFVPDLLNDPRVYVGKCPDASCYNMFGGEADQCSTSRLCPEGQYCCNDGCKNECRFTPAYTAMMAREQARAKQHQEMIIRRQQEEMARRQQEMLIQRQRQQATAERARKRAEARAAAEAELAAQQERAKYEAHLRAVAGAQAQAKAVNNLQQRMALLKQQVVARSQPQTTTGSFLDNFVGEPQSVNNPNSAATANLQQMSRQTQPQLSPLTGAGYFSSNKRSNLAGTITNQINSPASVNPYTLQAQQMAQNKPVPNEILSLIQTDPQNVAVVPPVQNVASSSYPMQSVASGFPAQPAYPSAGFYPTTATQDYTYQSIGQLPGQMPAQLPGQSPYSQHAGQSPVNPILMHHAFEAAA